MIMISIENLTYRYHADGEAVLRNIDLTVKAGESVTVMGANGSGKSTLARIIAGLLNASQGRVGVNVAGDSELPVGILFQNPDNQFVAVTVEKEIAFSLENRGEPMAQMEKKVTETLARFGISHLRTRLMAELSGGEKQRVALAAVMVCQPPILILDEPDSYLDQAGKQALQEELAKLHRETPSMIQIRITQYPEVARLYSRLLVFERGKIVADGTPATTFEDQDLCRRTGIAFDLDTSRRIVIPSYRPPAKKGHSARLGEIRLERLSYSYPTSRPVLKGLNLELRAGEVLGLAGASGSGKSTLGHILCGLAGPTEGSLEYIDVSGQQVPADRLVGKVSGVFQQPERQFFLSTCLKEIAYGPGNLGHKLSSDEADGLFAMVGLDRDRFADRDPVTLSVGEKRRLAFAAVLAMSPDFVVLDEPTCALDQEGVGRFILMAAELKHQGRGLVVITHDGHVLRALADRILYLKDNLQHRLLSAEEFFQSGAYRTVVSSPEARAERIS